MSCVLCKIQTEGFGIKGLVILFSKTPLYMYVCIIYLFMNVSANSEKNLMRMSVCTLVKFFLNLILFCNIHMYYIAII
jgi:hypothetical protein